MFGKDCRANVAGMSGECGGRRYFRGGPGGGSGFWDEVSEHWARHRGRQRFGREFGGRLFEQGDRKSVV